MTKNISENKEKISYPKIEKIGKDLFRTKIIDTDEIFIGSMSDIFDKLQVPISVQFDILKENCEIISFEELSNICENGIQSHCVHFFKSGTILYRFGDKIFHIKDNHEFYLKLISDMIMLPKKAFKKSNKVLDCKYKNVLIQYTTTDIQTDIKNLLNEQSTY